MARNHGDKPFLVYEDETLTFTQAMDRVDALAHALATRYGVQKGDRVAVAMRNYPEWCLSFAAILSVGGISVSMNSWWKQEEMDYALRDCGAKVLICDDERYATAKATCDALGIKVLLVRSKQSGGSVDKWEDVVQLGNKPAPVDISPDDDATILYTSGTTGFPKGAVSTHRAIVSALIAPFYVWWFKPQFTFPVSMLSCLILLRHHDNIQRLWRRQETKIWTKLKRKKKDPE